MSWQTLGLVIFLAVAPIWLCGSAAVREHARKRLGSPESFWLAFPNLREWRWALNRGERVALLVVPAVGAALCFGGLAPR